MPEGDSPTIARRRVRLALREARELATLTQLQVAEEMEWSLSKVIRIENGDVSIAPNDLRPLLGLLNIKDKAVVADLVADARIARTRQRRAWFQTPEFREHLTPALMRLIEYEAEAAAIRSYTLLFLPGPLQVIEYSRALLENYEDDITEDQRRLRLEARQLRRQTLMSRLGSVEIYVLLEESVLWRPIGGMAAFAAQLRELRKLASDGLIHIRMIPFTSDIPVTNNAMYDLLSLGDDAAGSEVLYRETGLQDELIEDRATTGRHHERYMKLWNRAASEEDTIAFIGGRIEELEANTNRPQ